LIGRLAPLLGEEGLHRLEHALLERGGIDRHLREQIAQARGDVEAYLALFDDRQLSWPDTAASVALQLLRAAPAWDDARIAVLEALGRSEEAQRHRWQCFCRTLAIPRLRAYLQHLADFEDGEAEAEALAVAEAHPQPLLALQFLVGWPALPRAARHVLSHRRTWDGEAFEIYGPAAERLSADHPLAATVLLRSMVVFALASGRSQRFRHAAGHLRACEVLDVRIDGWQGVESHAGFVGRLREEFATSRSFWRLLER
jgi:hypothetical protein